MTDKPDALLLSAKLESGQFEMTLRIPLPCDVDQARRAMEAWLKFAMTGIEIGTTDMTATFENGDARG